MNSDKKVYELLHGNDSTKPRKAEKEIIAPGWQTLAMHTMPEM